MEDGKTPWINLRDGAIGALASLLALASWTLPEKRWPAFADRLARSNSRLRGALSSDELAMIRIVVGDRPASWIEQTFWPQCLAHKYLSWMQILAGHGPRRWQPASRLIGKEQVDRALEKGNGVVLFTATFTYKDLMAKAAFHQAGYALHHLSKDTHGFSETVLGKRWLNPIYTSIEERYLQERMVFSGNNTKAISERVQDCLKRNRPVMITVTPLGRHVATRPFLHGNIHIATGGLNFACANGAPVLPVFALRQADGSVTTVVGEALDQPAGLSRIEQIDAMIDDYVPRLETQVESYPDQFSYAVSGRFGKLLLGLAEPRSAAIVRPVQDLRSRRPNADRKGRRSDMRA